MGPVRAIFILVVLAVVTPPMMLVQWLLLALKSGGALASCPSPTTGSSACF